MTDQKSETVRLVEVGPRDGLQSLDYRLSIETRLEGITRLSQSGLSEIECGAFVRPDRVPAMASSDQLFTKIKKSQVPKFHSFVKFLVQVNICFNLLI